MQTIWKIVDIVKDIFRVDSSAMIYGAAFGGAVSFLLGGFDQSLKMLIILVVLDYFMGTIAAYKTGVLNSKVGFKGLCKKAAIFIIIAFVNIADGAMQTNHLLRSIIICGYGANEALSILENVDRLGYGEFIPDFLNDKLEQIRENKIGRSNK